MKIYFGMLLVSMMLVSGCLQGGKTTNDTSGNTSGQASNETAITEEMCKQYGGNWNSCGSACRGAAPGTACVEVCIPYCECGGIAGFSCPPNYVCTDYLPKDAADAMGICKRRV